MAKVLKNFARSLRNVSCWNLVAVIVLSFAAASFNHAQKNQPTHSEILALTHVNVIDGKGSNARPDLTVVIEDDRIIDVGPRSPIPKGAQVINAAGKFLIPGLWDMHVQGYLPGAHFQWRHQRARDGRRW